MVKQTAGRDQLGEFVPKFAQLNDDILFGEVWNREGLSLKLRSILTVTVLVSKGLVDSSFQYHLQSAKNNGLTRSMSKKGCSPDNSACEGFFGRLKNEMFYGRSWEGVSIPEFIHSVDDYMRWYNEDRIKLSLGALSPAAYRHSLGFTI